MQKKTKKIIYLFANWKMYLNVKESAALAGALRRVKINPSVRAAVFPSALAFSAVAGVLKKSAVWVGAQNVYWTERGGYTGEISAAMYKDAGARFALVGHSERRRIFNESNHEVRQKIEACLNAAITPVICVGETLKEKEAGETNEILEIQLRSALEGLKWPRLRELIIAYEPVWAISHGTAPNAGMPCDPVTAATNHATITEFVRGLLRLSPVVLYGGSVRPENVAHYLTKPNINGVLVGANSTKAAAWKEIVAAVNLC